MIEDDNPAALRSLAAEMACKVTAKGDMWKKVFLRRLLNLPRAFGLVAKGRSNLCLPFPLLSYSSPLRCCTHASSPKELSGDRRGEKALGQKVRGKQEGDREGEKGQEPFQRQAECFWPSQVEFTWFSSPGGIAMSVFSTPATTDSCLGAAVPHLSWGWGCPLTGLPAPRLAPPTCSPQIQYKMSI